MHSAQLKQKANAALALPQAALVPKPLKELIVAMVETIEQQQQQINQLLGAKNG